MKTLYYDLFELMSREHGLTLLDTEMQEIIQVSLEIERKRQEKMKPTNYAPDKDGKTKIQRYYEMREAVENLSVDMHQWSTRPCETCRAVSLALGKPFGCYAHHARLGREVEDFSTQP